MPPQEQSSAIPSEIAELLSGNKTPVVSTTGEVGSSPPNPVDEKSEGQDKEEEEEEKEIVRGSMADVQKQFLNKWLEDCQRIIFLTIAFVNSEMKSPSSQQQRDLLDKMKCDTGVTQSAIEFVAKYDVKEYVNKEEAEAKLMEAMVLIRVQVRGMREVLMGRGCKNYELHGFLGRRCDCFDLANPFSLDQGQRE